MSFFWVHGEWIVARNKQINREPLRDSRDLFVPRYDSYPMNPEKNTHSSNASPRLKKTQGLELVQCLINGGWHCIWVCSWERNFILIDYTLVSFIELANSQFLIRNITDYPFLGSNNPSLTAYGDYPTIHTIHQGFVSFRGRREFHINFSGRNNHGTFETVHYEVLWLTLHWSDISLTTDLVIEWDLITDFGLISKFREVSIEQLQRMRLTEDAYSSGHLVLSLLDLHLF